MWKFGDAGDRPRKIEKIVSDLIGQEDADRFWLEFRKNYITEADIRRIAELGFNSVRPALNARRFLTEGDNPAYVDEGFRLLDDLVRWCGKHNVYVIIDMHGAPGGQTGTNIDDSANDQPELFMDPKYEKRLIDLWVKIAERYKDEPTVAGYDLLNEPLPERTGAAAKYKQELEPLYRRITTAIRKVDKKHMIILEGADWSNDWSVFSKPFAPNLVYQFHYYCWDNPDNLRDISPYLDFPQEVERPRVGRRDRRKQQHNLLGDDAVLREQQHRLVVLAVEEDGRRQWTILDQEAGRVGRDRCVLSRPRQAFEGNRPAGLQRASSERQDRELRVQR